MSDHPHNDPPHSDAPHSAFPAEPLPFPVPLTVLPAEPCPYLPDRPSQYRAFMSRQISGEVYEALLGANFRRSGLVFYQPMCTGCRQCRQFRVIVADHRPTKSQRRIWRCNADLKMELSAAEPNEEKAALYSRYLADRHETIIDATVETLREGLYSRPSGIESVDVLYRAGGRLVGVGVCDVLPNGLSTVYFYWEPSEARRGLGVFSALFEIELCRRMSLQYYFLGFWVGGCDKMEYKAKFAGATSGATGAAEILGTDGQWRYFVRESPST